MAARQKETIQAVLREQGVRNQRRLCSPYSFQVWWRLSDRLGEDRATRREGKLARGLAQPGVLPSPTPSILLSWKFPSYLRPQRGRAGTVISLVLRAILGRIAWYFSNY